ncbi:MAG TPA: hypothetical protein VM582_09340, partial [Candidatus Thermoplasmatota archaeon]|nr:hypothetical protein [Candidatus Thermoplasmatota archaeon]
AAEKRLRTALFQLETFTELVVAQQLHDEANATRSADADKRTLIASRTAAMRADAQREWASFRATLAGYDDEVRSVQTIEKILYAGDIALVGILSQSDYDILAREYPRQSGVPLGYTLALVRASHTAALNIGWARDLLAEAVKGEGLPPRVLDEPWSNLTRVAVVVEEEDPGVYLRSLDQIGRPVRENNESLLSIAIALAEQRATRAHTMQTLFGDARTRGLDVVRDAARGMNRQLNNTSVELPRSFGLTGVFTSDAIDRAEFTNTFVAAGQADLGAVIAAWSTLEHQGYVLLALAQVSPVRPPEETNDTPGASFGLVALALVGVALLSRRRSAP